jgi:hypothetical protein
MKKRLYALLLVFVLFVTMLPQTVIAAPNQVFPVVTTNQDLGYTRYTITISNLFPEGNPHDTVAFMWTPHGEFIGLISKVDNNGVVSINIGGGLGSQGMVTLLLDVGLYTFLWTGP